MSDARPESGWWQDDAGTWHPREAHPDHQPPPPPRSVPLALRILGIVGAGIGLGILAAAISNSADSYGPSQTSSELMCEQFLEDRLRAPATADYTHELFVAIDEDTARIDGYVDAENAFGALIRSDFSCEVTHVSGDQWKLDDLTLS